MTQGYDPFVSFCGVLQNQAGKGEAEDGGDVCHGAIDDGVERVEVEGVRSLVAIDFPDSLD